MLVIHDLGELVVERGAQPCDPGGAKPRTILALLCAHAGRPVPAAVLITEVWGPDAPERTQRALESQIWRLRKALSPQGEASAIITDRAGYRLDLADVVIDSLDFDAAAAAALDASRSPTVGDLEDVLRRWRGEPFTSATSTPTLDQARRRLHAVRAALLTRRADLLLAAGDLDRALDEAQALITRDPLDEHAWSIKISALSAGGQRSEALTAYRDIRELLATELGVEPGTEVRAAQRHVLDDHTRAVRRVRLPTQHTSFVGRDTELAEVIRLLETERAVAITGIPGVGKTRLAIESARRAADFFDDGVWFIARRDDTELGTTILETMRIAPSADAGATAMDQVCAYLSTMSVLLVLDSRSGSDGRRGRPGDNDIDILLRQCAAVTVLAVGAPSWLFRPTADDRPRPTIVMPCGYDSTAESGWGFAQGALARGYNVLSVEGPGQGSTLINDRIYFRPDYEVVLSQILDWLGTVPDVDNRRLVAQGRSFAGYLIPRGVAGESRVAAMICDPAQPDMGAKIPAGWKGRIAAPLMTVLGRISRERADFFASRMACHGVHTIAEYLTELGSFTMLDRAGDISCPTFIVESHGDPVGGPGKTLFDALTVERKQLYAPAKSTGVSGHCGGLGQRVWDDVVYDWLDGVLADRTAAASHPASAPTAIGERR